MATPTITDYIKYASLQMAAEAFLLDAKGNPFVTPGDLRASLVRGNGHASKFTISEAQNFADHWVVLDQLANTGTGFSGTLFQCIKDDPTTGAKAGELTISFRSTEFVDDAVRDNLATNTDEIKNTGWAWGQISDMEKWYATLKADSNLLGNKPFSVTGYSLGGHLATAFNLLHNTQVGPGEIVVTDSAAQQVVTFNGAGVGKVTSGTLQAALDTFNKLRKDYTQIEARFTDPGLATIYTDIRNHLADNSWTLDQAIKALQPVRLDDPIGTDAALVISALSEIKDLKAEAARVALLKAGGSDNAHKNDSPTQVADKDIEAENLDYRMAVKYAAMNTDSKSIIANGIQAINGKLLADKLFNNQFDVVGATSPSAVSNSLVHYGNDVQMFIEDQPLYRGGIAKDVVVAALDYGSIKLLVDGYAIKDFGDTHSLVLLVDSLNVQNALFQLSTDAQKSATEANLKQILDNASNLRQENGAAFFGKYQGKAEGDVLENVVNSLADMLGLNWQGSDRLKGNPAGGTWAITESAQEPGFSDRTTFYSKLTAITSSDLYKKALLGKVQLVAPPANGLDAKSDFGALLSLVYAAPFAIKADGDALNALKVANKALADKWDASGFSDTYLQARAMYVQRKLYYNDLNARYDESNGYVVEGDDKATKYDAEDIVWIDRASQIKIQRARLSDGTMSSGITGKTAFVYFGTEADESNIKGDGYNDSLFGGGGNDTLTGFGGDDFLEGGSGDDILNGGDGNDRYSFAAGDGQDTIIDSDGLGSIVVNGNAIGNDIAGKSVGFIWTGLDGTKYTYSPGNSNNPLVANGSTLTISNGALGANDQIVIKDFDLSKAENSGYLGIKLAKQTALVSGNGGDPFNTGNYNVAAAATTTRGSVQGVTIYVSGISDKAQTLSLNLTGFDASQFKCNTGADVLDFTNGKVALTVPAGSDRVTIGLVYIGDPTQKPIPQLSSALVDASGSADAASASNILSITFDNSSVNSNANPDNTINGDLKPINFSTTGDTVYHYDSLDNVVTGGTVEPNRNDTLIGSTGNDVFNTGGGTNVVRAQQGGNDTINGGLGSDQVFSGNGNNLIQGSGGQDVIIAGNGQNKIYAGTTVDFATALGARSGVVSGGKGSAIAVGDGNNTIVGGTANDVILMGTGNNLVVLGSGAVTLNGGVETTNVSPDWTTYLTPEQKLEYVGFNTVSSPFSAPPTYQGSTFQGVPVGIGNDTIFGGIGDSTYFLSNGDNYLDAGGGNDYIQAGIGNNTIFGGRGNDTIFGGGGHNYIDIESGNTLVVAQGGNSTIIGGVGKDTIYSGDAGANWATSQTNAINYIRAGSGNTLIYGSGGNDTLQGGSGNDTIYAGSGNATVLGGGGSDQLWGGGGTNIIYAGDGGTSALATQVVAGDGNTTVYGGNGVDHIFGGKGNNVLYAGDGGTANAQTFVQAGSGNTTIYGGNGIDVITGGAGTNVLFAGNGGTSAKATVVQAGTGNTTIYGGNGIDKIIGGAGANVLYAGDGGTTEQATLVQGGSGNTTIYGGTGTNILQGGSGDTLFVAGTGNETIRGGSGSNTYQIDAHSGNIVLANVGGNDKIIFGTGINAANLIVTATFGSGGAPALQIQGNNGETITINGGLSRAIDNISFAGSGNTLSLRQLISQATWVDSPPTDMAQLENQYLAQRKTEIVERLQQQGYTLQADGTWFKAPGVEGQAAAIDTTLQTTINVVSGNTIIQSSTTQEESWEFGRNYGYSGYALGDQKIVDRSTTLLEGAVTANDAVINANDVSSTTTSGSVGLAVRWRLNTDNPIFRGSSISSLSGYLYADGTTGTQYVEGATPVTVDRHEARATYNAYGSLSSELLPDPATPLTGQGPLPGVVSAPFYHSLQTYDLQAINVGLGNHTVYGGAVVNAGSGNNDIEGAAFVYAGTGNNTIKFAKIVYAGSGNNTISQSDTIYGGSGNNRIDNAQLVYGGSGNNYISNTAIVYAGSGNDTISGSQTVYGGSGNHLIIGSDYGDDYIVAGSGNDTIYGQGSENIVINPHTVGTVLIGNKDNYHGFEILDAFYRSRGIDDWYYRYTAPGSYAITSSSSYNGLTADQAASILNMPLQQAIAEGKATLNQPLPYLAEAVGSYVRPAAFYATSGTPVIQTFAANDFAAVDLLFDAGLYRPDEKVTFGEGVAPTDLHFSWGKITTSLTENSTDPQQTYRTLNIDWGTSQGVRIIIPSATDPFGSGVGEFDFADGSKLSLADLLALAPPDGFVFRQGMGQRTFAGDFPGIYFAAGITQANVQVTRDGIDLLISASNSADSLRVANWFADLNALPTIPAIFNDGSKWDASTLTAKGLTVDGSAGNRTLTGLAGFQSTLVSGPGDILVGTGKDIFEFNLGGGQQTLVDNGDASQEVIRFGAGISAADSLLEIRDGKLYLNYGTQGDSILLKNVLQNIADSTQSFEKIQYADGSRTFSSTADNQINLSTISASGNFAGSAYVYRDATSISAGNFGYENGSYIGLGSSQKISFPDGSTVEDIFRNNSLVFENRHYAAGWSESTTFYANGARRSYYHNDGQGNSTTNHFDVNGGVTGDDYVRADGSHGTDLFKTDGSSNGEKHSADRTYSKYVNDGLGNIFTTYFNADGNLTRTFVEVDDASGNKLSDSWANADGSYGSDTFNADGSSNGTTHNTDGSYSSYTSFSPPGTNQPETDTTYFNAQGIKVKYTTASADGASTTDIFNADGSRETIRIYAGGYGSTDTIYAAGGSGSYRQTSIYYNGVAGYDNFTITDAQGSYHEEYGDTSGYSGTYNYNAVAGTSGGTDHYSDGSSDIYRNDSSGDYHEQDYDALGRETRNYFYRNADGYYSHDYFNADGTSNGDSHNPDGRYSQYAYDGHGATNTQYFDANGTLLKYDVSTNDGQGNIVTNIFDATGNKTGDSWVHADGTSGSDTFNADGSVEAKITYTYADGSAYSTDTVNNSDGSYQQSWSQSNGSHGATSYNATTGEVIGSNSTAGAGYSYTYDNTKLAVGSTESKITYTYDDGSTYATDTVNNPDGSYQQSWSQSNGSHGSTSYNAATGEVIGSNSTAGAGYSYTYDNTKLAGGSTESQITYTYADGSTYATNTVNDPDGSYQQSWNQSNGSHGSTSYNAATGEVIGSNSTAGAGYSYTYDNTKLAGGSTESKITYTYDDGSTYGTDTINNPDGSYQQSWTQSNGSHGSTNYNALSGEVIGSNSTAGAGYSYTYDDTKLVGGSTESKVTYTYADGSTYATDTVNNPDGSYQQSWSQSNGSHGSTSYNAVTGEVIGSNTTAGAGYSYTYDNTKLAGGSTESKVTYTYADGSTYATDTVNNSDGSYQQSWSQSNGSHGATSYNAVNGEVIGSNTTAGAGYSYTYDNTKLAGGSTESKATYTYDDGSTYATDTVNNPDGSYFQSWVKSDGTAGSVTVNGSGAVVGTNSVLADGSQTVAAGGNLLVIGSAANDSIVGQAGNDILIGGRGNDTVTSGAGTNVFAFDKGDGQDVINAVSGQNNTISLGGNFAYSDLALQKSGDDLVLDIGNTDSLTFKGWYAGNNKIVNLQVIASAMSDFNPGSTDILRNSNVEGFDFQRLVSAFDQAQAASPSANPWNVTNALLDAHLSSSDTAAVGGDLANVYGIRGSLSGFGIEAGETQLSSSQFASAPQTLSPWPVLKTGTAQIR